MTPILSATLLRTQSDARLATLTREGNEGAFETLVERYRRALHRYLRRMLPESRTEDALQQTFIKAWSALRDGRAEVNDLKPWLYRIARNTALDALKKSGYDYEELHESLRSANGPDVDLERRTVMRETLTGVAALPDRQREALLRIAVEGQSRAQVAQDLGLSDGAVRQLVHRARMTLRAAATAVTPLPLATWAAARGGHGGPVTQRVAELAAGGGAAGGAGVLLKGGAVIVAAGALAAGPSALHTDPGGAKAPVGASAEAAGGAGGERVAGGLGATVAELADNWASGRSASSFSARARSTGRGSAGSDGESGDDHSGSADHGGAGDDRSGSGGGESSGSSGPGPGGGDASNRGPGGGDLSGSDSGGPGPSGGGSSSGSESGSSGASFSGDGGGGSGSSGSGSSSSGSSSSGSSGSGSSGSGSGGSGPG